VRHKITENILCLFNFYCI